MHESLEDNKALDTVSIDLRGKALFADAMVIASGRSGRHISSIAGNLTKLLKAEGYGPIRVEGQDQGDWVLLDAGNVIVHLFRPEVREFYNLEKMWSVDMSAQGTSEQAAG